MSFLADLHIHSHLSRATSSKCTLEGLHEAAQRKGVSLVATGDFTHPAWFAELQGKLVPAGPGVYALEPGIRAAVDREVPSACRAEVRFLLNVEISSIYKRDGAVRKVHTLIYVPDLDAAARLNKRLDALGNIKSDGRPILGLDPRDLVELALEASPEAFVIPAHIWTPWFSMLGSKSGFDSLEECFGPYADRIFAVETGLSSDPPMNWRVSSLDRLALVSNSDLHSPAKLGRNANVFHCAPDYFAVREALRSKDPTRFGGTLDLFPEEGKYHCDGHRKCGVVMEPEESLACDGICPVCGKPLVLGVNHRVVELADRARGEVPAGVLPCEHIVPLAEILSELLEVGAGSKKVQAEYDRLLNRLGPELQILRSAPIERLEQAGLRLLGEAVRRVRAEEVIRKPGYDGEYGEIRVFAPGDRDRLLQQAVLFSLPRPLAARASVSAPPAEVRESGAPVYELEPLEPAAASASVMGGFQPLLFKPEGEELLEGLSPEQRAAAGAGADAPAVLVVAGPGAGKTRTLTTRIAWLLQTGRARAEEVMAVTFTNRAAREIRTRLASLVGDEVVDRLRIGTFHRLCLDVLREHADAAGLDPEFELLDEETLADRLHQATGLSVSAARDLVAEYAVLRARDGDPDGIPGLAPITGLLRDRRVLMLDDVVQRTTRLLEGDPELRDGLQVKWLCVDEFQDVNRGQYAFVQVLARNGCSLFAIGDPDQAIYGFRGGDAGLMESLVEDLPGVRVFRLSANHRSDACIVDLAQRVIREGADGSLSVKSESVFAPRLKVRVHEAASAAAEAEFVTHEIEKWLGGVASFSLDTDRVSGLDSSGVSFGDIAVLVRLHALVEPVAAALRRLGLPVETVQPARARAALNALRLLRSFHDSQGRTGGGRALEGALDELQGSAVEAETVAWLRDWAGGRSASGLTLAGALESLLLEGEQDRWRRAAERVSVMSCHAAKGLEFPIVFVVACEDGVIPYIPPDAAAPADELEERRLFYVAMTRAQRVLYLTHSRKRTLFGTLRETRRTPFLQAVPQDLLHELGTKSHARDSGPRQLELDLGL